VGGEGAGAQAAGSQQGPDASQEQAANQEQDAGEAQVTDAISDEELDAYILTRLKSLGLDLSVLPEDDEDAPADQRFEMDPQVVAPVMYPSETSHRTRRDEP
jgi:hypothetical protein